MGTSTLNFGAKITLDHSDKTDQRDRRTQTCKNVPQGKEQDVVVVIEIDAWLHKCQKRLKGQFLFQLEVAELIRYWKKEHILKALSLVH